MTPKGLSVVVRRRLGAYKLDVAFEAAPSGVTALFGVSGAGKSCALAAVAGTLRPDSGRIALGEEPLFDSDLGVDVPPERRGIGFVFQDPRLFPHLTVRGNLGYGTQRARARSPDLPFEQVVEVLGIEPLLARRPRDLSGGERQRVSIGRALLSRPRLLLMDEPLSALDQPRRAEILPMLERLGGLGLPIVYVTHSLGEVVRLADRLVVLDEGRVVTQGPLAQVLGAADVPLLATRADAGAALELRVTAHEPARGLTRLESGALELIVPSLEAPAGASVRALVLARDVLLARARPERISARNLLPARVLGLAPRKDGSVLVRLALSDGQVLLSAVTSDAVRALELGPGMELWAVLKSVAVEGAARGEGAGGLLALFDDLATQ